MRAAPIALVLAACASPLQVTETRMMTATPREAHCTLALVQLDPQSPTFNQTWDILGYVTISGAHTLDANAEDNKKRVRARACAMGGTTIAVAAAAGQPDAALVSYAVLRPKGPPGGILTF